MDELPIDEQNLVRACDLLNTIAGIAFVADIDLSVIILLFYTRDKGITVRALRVDMRLKYFCASGLVVT